MPILDLPALQASTVLCAPWLAPADLPDRCAPADPETPTDAELAAVLAASEVLYFLSGQQYGGVCSTTVTLGVHQQCTGRCGDRPTLLPLGGYPVVEVVSVTVGDDVLVAGTDYQVVDRRHLQRLTGGGWPCGGTVVTFSYGQQPPSIGVRAAGVLACELLAADAGDECALPERVTSISRQGVSAVVLDPMAFLDNGRTGLYAVDLFLSAVNPGGLRRRATVTTTKSRRRAPRHVS